jgi:hypothetical protein
MDMIYPPLVSVVKSARIDGGKYLDGKGRIGVWNSRKKGLSCEHGRERTRCKDCGGSSICKHNIVRTQCKACGGSGFCVHGRQKTRCTVCRGESTCEHDTVRKKCSICSCVHGLQKGKCNQCKSTRTVSCVYGKTRKKCKDSNSANPEYSKCSLKKKQDHRDDQFCSNEHKRAHFCCLKCRELTKRDCDENLAALLLTVNNSSQKSMQETNQIITDSSTVLSNNTFGISTNADFTTTTYDISVLNVDIKEEHLSAISPCTVTSFTPIEGTIK